MTIPQIVAWETTRRCELACRHCRAGAGGAVPDARELSAAEGLRLVEALAALPVRLLILTGGEPMMRPDILDLVRAAADRGIRVAMAPCGPLLNEESAARLKRAGLSAVSISLDDATAAGHDAFRGVAGAFESALRGLRCARTAGLAVQVNTTVSRLNVAQLPAILDLAEREGAGTLDLFFLVPTGRGRALRDRQLDAEQAERTLNWIADTDGTRPVRLKTTCAPQMARIRAERGQPQRPGMPTGGCMAGRGFLFVSHVGLVQPCGFLDLPCGDVRAFDFDLKALLAASVDLRRLGDPDGLGGSCGSCVYRRVCGGCRARAHEMLGDALGAEPFCVGPRDPPAAARRPARIREIVVALQRGVPLEPRPFDALARSLGVEEPDVLSVAGRMLEDGTARRFGAVFDARRLGYRSELCAIDAPAGDLDRIGALVAAQAGVTHAYRRGHPPGLAPFPEVPGVDAIPNLWFTLAVLHDRYDETLALFQIALAPFAIRRFPAVRRFKIDVIFDMDQRAVGEQAPGMPGEAGGPIDEGFEPLTGADRQLVRALQGNMPVRPDLFARVAAELGWPADALLDRLRAWQRSGLLRRVGLIVRHRRIGYAANAMCVWPVDPAAVVEAGRRLAAWPAVTHCYERATRPDWPYNLYAMIHTADWAATRDLFERIGGDAGLTHGRLLGSLHEYKKTSMRYFSENGSAADA